MEWVPVVTLAILALMLTIALLVTVGWARSEVTARGVEQDGRMKAEDNKAKVERVRDDLIAQLTKTEVERDQARHAAEVFERSAMRAREELAKHVREKLVTGSDDDVADEVDRLLTLPQ